jgi:hypothetical protein
LKRSSCKVCSHMESKTLDRFLCMPEEWEGKRGPRSLAAVFGLDRRAIARHERVCLARGGQRRAAVEEDLRRLAGEGEGMSIKDRIRRLEDKGSCPECYLKPQVPRVVYPGEDAPSEATENCPRCGRALGVVIQVVWAEPEGEGALLD